MASIRKLISGKYNCQIRRKGIKSRSKTFETFEEANAWALSQDGSIPSPHAVYQIKSTFKELGLRYIATVLKGRPSQNEQLRRINRMASHFPQRFDHITKWDVNSYKNKRLVTVSGSTCRDELLILSRLFKWVKRELLIDLPNPCEEVALPRASKPRNKVITPEELDAMLELISPNIRPVIELAFETAMRRSELLRLTPKCLHLSDRLLDVIDGKTGDRSVPLTKRAVEILTKAIIGVTNPEQRLFPFAPCSVSQALRRARIKLGLSKDIRFHQLRHTRITMVAKMGFNQAQIMMVSGHRDSRSVQRYTHLNVRDVIDLLD